MDTSGCGHVGPWTHRAVDCIGLWIASGCGSHRAVDLSHRAVDRIGLWIASGCGHTGIWTHWDLDTSGFGHIGIWTHRALDTLGFGHIGLWTHWDLDTSGFGHNRPWTHRGVVTSGFGHNRPWTHRGVVTSGFGQIGPWTESAGTCFEVPGPGTLMNIWTLLATVFSLGWMDHLYVKMSFVVFSVFCRLPFSLVPG